MRWIPLVILPLLIAALALPAAAGEGNRIGYVSFEGVSIQLKNEKALVEVEYSLDPGMTLILIFFGTGDLQRKAERSLNFPGAKAEEVTLRHAVFSVEGVSEDYGGRAYWFRPHTFGITFPRVTVRTDGSAMTYRETRTIPRGFGYFGETE